MIGRDLKQVFASTKSAPIKQLPKQILTNDPTGFEPIIVNHCVN